MKLANFIFLNEQRVGVVEGGRLRPLPTSIATSIDQLIRRQAAGESLASLVAHLEDWINVSDVRFLTPVMSPSKIICVGLNYADHTKESAYAQPDYPTLFLRLATSLTAHAEALIRPLCSDSLDFEGELVCIMGRGGKHIAMDQALSHVYGYSIFNDGSVREYQFKSPQWTVGKTFDKTGGFGPVLVTADELPPGAKGLMLETRLNGQTVQKASTADMLFDVATLISVISEAITLMPGDVIVAGTPAGIGWSRTPRLLMRHGDVCEVSIEGIGTLRNRIEDEILA